MSDDANRDGASGGQQHAYNDHAGEFGDGDSGTPSTSENAAAPAADESRSSELIAKVLGETLSRKRENPRLMIESLRRWRRGLAAMQFDRQGCHQLVSQVLEYRLGDSAKSLPEQLKNEVSEVLWNNPEARRRIERLWNAITAL